MLRVGVDVGGTNTDAVIMDGSILLGACKRPTTEDIESGVVEAITSVLGDAGRPPSQLDAVMIGTTQFTNAFVEARRLMRVGVLRLALPASTAVPPFSGWPQALQAVVEGSGHIVHGGYEFDGREISPLDEDEIRAVAEEFGRQGLTSVAISCAFSPINDAMEVRAGKIVQSILPAAKVSLSSAFGRMGLIERENAATMNASLTDLAAKVVGSFRQALRNIGVTAPLFISQNDGTLMSSQMAERNPVMTFASGPTNSMRGAAFLTGLSDAIVVDIGGTTSDIGSLTQGFPRESSLAVDIGGVRSNFRAPDILSIGLGGGSLVTLDPATGKASVGPRSVGHRIRTEALVFGGSTLTATDIVVASGWTAIGDKSRVDALASTSIAAAADEIARLLSEGIDRIKIQSADVPLILVGGGSILIRSAPKGVSELYVPKHADVANAIGAAIAQVSGEVDHLFDFATQSRDEALGSARRMADTRAIEAGADPASLVLVEMDELPLNYLPGDRVRIRAKVVGDLEVSGSTSEPKTAEVMA